MYWWMHILVGFVLMIVPARPRSKSQGQGVKATDKSSDQVTDKVAEKQVAGEVTQPQTLEPEVMKKEQ